ncbi:MAG: hypothetical protein ACXAAO_09970 [Candidatus Thorarchaeota archaeon]|jgi:hypothetical protein
MSATVDIEVLVRDLVSYAYPELQEKKLDVSWSRMSNFGQVRWSDEDDRISIRIDNSVRAWNQVGITGLLSHELSHPALSESRQLESRTDGDVLSRGLGPYLAVERVLAGKYDDHIILRGKDRYLGYRTIRDQLTPLELDNLDALMSDLKLKPSVQSQRHQIYHDSAIYEKKGISKITIEGHQFSLPNGVQNPDIKIVDREGLVSVYADEVLVGSYQEEDSL